MFAAVDVNHVTKEFLRPGMPLEGSLARLNSRGPVRLAGLARPAALAAVEDISFTVQPGECFGLVGPSGSGKSTLIRLLAAQIAPDQGHIAVFGWDAAGQPQQVQRMTNRISGAASFYPRRSVLENLAHAAHGQSLPQHELRQQARTLLLRLGLTEEDLTQPMILLPRSRQQIVFLVHALLPLPRLLLLDEPLRDLEAHARRQTRLLLEELCHACDLTIVMATRDEAAAATLCDRYVSLRAGRMTAIAAGELPLASGAAWPLPQLAELSDQ